MQRHAKRSKVRLTFRFFGMTRQLGSLSPIVVQIRLIFPNETIHIDFHHVVSTGALNRMFAVLDPTFQSEIRRFGTVKTVVETPMIRVGKSDDEFALVLGDLSDGNRFVAENGRSDDRHFMPKKRWTTSRLTRKMFCGEFFELFAERRRNDVPKRSQNRNGKSLRSRLTIVSRRRNADS